MYYKYMYTVGNNWSIYHLGKKNTQQRVYTTVVQRAPLQLTFRRVIFLVWRWWCCSLLTFLFYQKNSDGKLLMLFLRFCEQTSVHLDSAINCVAELQRANHLIVPFFSLVLKFFSIDSDNSSRLIVHVVNVLLQTQTEANTGGENALKPRSDVKLLKYTYRPTCTIVHYLQCTESLIY